MEPINEQSSEKNCDDEVEDIEDVRVECYCYEWFK